MRYKQRLLLVILLIAHISTVFSQTTKLKKYENVVYGMVSGTALLMDVYQPANTNHIGIIMIEGSGFGYFDTESYNNDDLKSSYNSDPYFGKCAQALVGKGYTVFMINHRTVPRYHYPDIVYDCQRAVRFIRYNAKNYEIDPVHIGAMGHSSGAYLVSMLGVTDTAITNAENGVDSCSSKVQAVVTLAAPFDMGDLNIKEARDSTIKAPVLISIVETFMGELPPVKKGEFYASGKYLKASPVFNVTKNTAAFLIYYSDNDPYTPVRQGMNMSNKLIENNVPAKLVLRSKTKHHPDPDMNEVNTWFRKYLQ